MDTTVKALWITLIISGIMIPLLSLYIIYRSRGTLRGLFKRKKNRGTWSNKEKFDTLFIALLTIPTLTFLYSILFLLRAGDVGNAVFEGVVGALSGIIIAAPIIYGAKQAKDRDRK